MTSRASASARAASCPSTTPRSRSGDKLGQRWSRWSSSILQVAPRGVVAAHVTLCSLLDGGRPQAMSALLSFLETKGSSVRGWWSRARPVTTERSAGDAPCIVPTPSTSSSFVADPGHPLPARSGSDFTTDSTAGAPSERVDEGRAGQPRRTHLASDRESRRRASHPRRGRALALGWLRPAESPRGGPGTAARRFHGAGRSRLNVGVWGYGQAVEESLG